MSLLVLLRPSKASAGGVVVQPADTHDGADGWRKRDFTILTETQWKEIYQGKAPKKIEIEIPDIPELQSAPEVEEVQRPQNPDLDDARAKYLYQGYKAQALADHLSGLKEDIRRLEILMDLDAGRENAKREVLLEKALHDQQRLQTEQAAAEKLRANMLMLLEEMDAQDFMVAILLH